MTAVTPPSPVTHGVMSSLTSAWTYSKCSISSPPKTPPAAYGMTDRIWEVAILEDSEIAGMTLRDAGLISSLRKPSTRERVRLPWAIVVPKGLSLFARSTSTWIHWWSPESSAKVLMSSWVTVRHSLGPTSWPTSACIPSIPCTSVGAIGGQSIRGGSVAPPAGDDLTVAFVCDGQVNVPKGVRGGGTTS